MEKEFINNNDIKSEIVNLAATLNLPKGTEVFVSDIHGDYDKFAHIMRSGSGNISHKIKEIFTGKLTALNQKKLACLIYYPSEVLTKLKADVDNDDDLDQWYMNTFNDLVEMLRYTASKYTRMMVRDAIDADFLNITEELLYTDAHDKSKQAYYHEIIESMIKLDMADAFIIATSHAIQRLVIERIHLIGDVYDRGAHPDYVINHLVDHSQNFDFEWGNHDILWMGAMAGSKLCMVNLLRICARYDNLQILPEAYDIDLTSLIQFAKHSYRPLDNFQPKCAVDISQDQQDIDNRIQQAAAIMQFKLEGQAIRRRPEFEMDDQMLLDKLNQDKKRILIDGQEYPITNGCFQLVNPANPYQITRAEQTVLIDLINQFTRSSKLNEHMWFMVDNGSIYSKHNGNLLFHGCIPVDHEGNFIQWKVDGQTYSGKKLCDYFETIVRDAMHHPTTGDCFNSDVLWYLWEGPDSPLFGKDRMRTFERYFVDDAKLQQEHLNPFYELIDQAWFDEKILQEFDLPSNSHIILGHTPQVLRTPSIRANGKVIVVNGGIKPNYGQPGNGGYTLTYDSYGLKLVTLKPFTDRADAINEMSDGVESQKIIVNTAERITVRSTGVGEHIKKQIEDLSAQLKNS